MQYTTDTSISQVFTILTFCADISPCSYSQHKTPPYHPAGDRPNGVALFPSQLVSSGLDFIHFAVLCVVAKKNKTPGRIGALYLIFYSIGRFCIEFFRGDLLRGSVGTLSTSQFISIFVAIAGAIMYGVLSLHKAENTDTDHTHDDAGK